MREGKVKAVHLKASRRGDWGPRISGCALAAQFLSHDYLFEILFPSNSTQCSEITWPSGDIEHSTATEPLSVISGQEEEAPGFP